MEKTNKLGTVRPQVDPKDTEAVVCPACGGKLFTEGVVIRKVSPLLTGTGQQGIMPVNVLYCTECHAVLKELLPKELQDIV